MLFWANLLYAQTNYYIAVNGNDNNNGSSATPWKTIQYGVTHAGFNDTLNISSGTFNEKINITRSNIYIRNRSGNTPLVSGAGITFQEAIFRISDQSNITLDGLEIANSIQLDAQGILVDGNAQNIAIKNCSIHDIHFSSNPGATVSSSKNAQGIIVYGTNASTAISNLKILNNTLYNCRLGYSEGLAVNGNVDGFEIIGNSVHDITNIGIDAIGHEGTCPTAANDQARNGLIKNNTTYNCLSAYATSGGLYVDGGKNIVIENNISYQNGYGIEIGCENVGKTTDNIIVRNNIFYGNEICAIALGGYAYPGGSGKVINCTIRNNTCFKNDYSDNGTGELYLTYSENSIIQNNIFYLSAQNILTYAELGQPSLNFNYNLIYSENSPANMEADWNGKPYTSFAAFKTGTSSNANSIIGNPQFFIDPLSSPDAPPNFHLTFSSAAINAGNPSFVPAVTERDIDNELRKSSIVDCGADEYYSSPLVIYTFIGNGNWNVAANWINNTIPPTTLSGNELIIIDPIANGECILNVEQHVENNSQLIINSGKKIKVSNMIINN
ncbi:right-handed parallel beta-helix repeat-containing protein [Ferruginibacter lapsinanis]|uniref:right-handed parallel beta-helix repeat-containing protein n=1 Tax=Ferruginibacter lapsinanis TaxID=563172 RepID=UPI001E37EFB5|nr:right-handed parallel beta-helix repeat-containing protein [Ferruginibacter lapsinanis]UEG48895.1 right-handed parallel beta-helix repeat-containing protein [Ferruginibacter lapsinanis]